MPSLPKCAVVSKTSPVLLSFSVSVMILKSHKEGKWLGNLLILSSSPPTHTPLKQCLTLQKSVFQSLSLPQHGQEQREGRYLVCSTRHSMNEHLITINKKPHRCQKAVIQQNEEEEREWLSARTPANAAWVGRRWFYCNQRTCGKWLVFHLLINYSALEWSQFTGYRNFHNLGPWLKPLFLWSLVINRQDKVENVCLWIREN